MGKLASLVLLILFQFSRVPAQDLHYPGETIGLPPFKLVVTGLKYSQGTRFNKPPPGFLFLVLTVKVTNPSPKRARFQWRERVTVTSGESEYIIDTVRNSQAQQNRNIGAGGEKKVKLWFVVPEITYETGAQARVANPGEKAVIDLRYADAYDGHLAAGLAWVDKKDYARALGEYRLASAFVLKPETERYNYLTYRMGEAYGKLFLYEEALEKFREILDQGPETSFYKESKGNFDLLKYKLEGEDKNKRAVRLVEAGYHCAFQIGEEAKALAIFKQLRTRYSGIRVGAFDTDHVAIMYTILVHINQQNYTAARALCQEALNNKYLCGNKDFEEFLKKQVQECTDQGGK